jgi:hypothetical protein
MQMGKGGLKPHFILSTRQRYALGEGSLYWAKPVGNSWEIQQIPDSVGETKFYFAIDKHDRPYVIGIAPVNQNESYYLPLDYFYFDGDEWHKELISDPDCPENFLKSIDSEQTCILIDGKDDPQILCLGKRKYPGSKCLYHVKRTAAGWHFNILDCVRFSIGRGNAIDLDSSGTVYISFCDEAANAIRLASLEGGVWNYDTITTSAFSHSYLVMVTDLKIDESGHFNVVSVEGYSDLTSDTWRTRPFDHIDLWNAEMALDGNGNPHVVYHLLGHEDKSIFCSRYMHFDGEQFHVECLPDSEFLRRYASIDINSSGTIGIAHPSYDYENNNVVLAYLFNKGAGWEEEKIPLPNLCDDLKLYTQLRFDPVSGYPVVCIGRKHALLRYNGSSWEREDIYQCNEGQYSTTLAMQITSKGHPHILFLDSYQVLYQYTDDGTNWVVKKIGDFYSAHLDFVLDDQDLPHICLFDYMHNILYYTRGYRGSEEESAAGGYREKGLNSAGALALPWDMNKTQLRIDFAPPAGDVSSQSPSSGVRILPRHWLIRGLERTNYPMKLCLVYSDEELQRFELPENKIQLMRSTDCGASWYEVPSIRNPYGNKIQMRYDASFNGIYAIGIGAQPGRASIWSLY